MNNKVIVSKYLTTVELKTKAPSSMLLLSSGHERRFGMPCPISTGRTFGAEIVHELDTLWLRCLR